MADRSIKVTLRADVQDFKNQFDQAAQAADRAGKATEDAGRKGQGTWGKLKQSAQENRQAWTTAGTTLTGFGAAILGVGAMAAKTGIEYNTLQQKAGSALEVLMGSAEGAARQMEKLNSFADNSPFQREIFIEAQQQLISFGVEAERVVPILSAVQDAVAATGGSGQDISELVNILSKVSSTGKITAQTLNELGYRGVDAATIIGEQMGKTGEQIRSEITAGTLDADAALQALTDGMSEKFGGAAAGLKDTFEGALDRVRAAWRDLSAELMTPLVSPDGGGLLVDMTNRLADIMRAVEGMPAPVRNAAGAMAGLTGAASLGAGAFLLLLPRALDTIDAFKVMAGSFPGVASGLTAVGKGAAKLGVVVGAAVAATVAIQKLTDAARGIDRAEFDLGANELAAALRDAEQSGDAFTATMGDLYNSGALNKQMFSDLGSSIQEVADINWFQSLIGPFAATGINEMKTRFEDLGGALAQVAQEDLPRAQAQFKAFYEEAAKGGSSFEEVMQVMPEFRDALVGIALDAGLATDDATLLKIATGELVPVVDEATGAVVGYGDAVDGAADAQISAAEASKELLDGLLEQGNAFLDAREAAWKYEDALTAAQDAIDANGKHWDDGTEAARSNAEAIDGLSESILDNADKMEANGEASGEWLKGQRQDLIDTAIEMGASEGAAKRYVDQLGLTPEYIATQIELDADAAQEKWNAIYADLWPEGGHPPLVIDPEVDPEGKIPEFTGLVDTIPPEVETTVGADTDQGIQNAYGFEEVIEGATEDKTATLGADVEPAMWEVNNLNAAIDAAGGTVTINGESVPADQVLDTLMGIINSSDGTVTIDGMSVPADQALDHVIAIINGSGGIVDIDGDNSGANAATDSAKRNADGTHGTISVGADTGSANSTINNAARTRYATIQVRARMVGGMPTVSNGQMTGVAARAAGGPIYGPGTGTSDSVPAALSNGEHVLTAREVSLAGGQGAVYRMREAIMGGRLRFADGGGVEGSGYAPAPAMSVLAPARSQKSTQAIDYAALRATVAAGAREGIESASVIATVTDRVAAGLHQRGASASRAYGGGR